MLCDNCGKREANVRYQENINGRKKELNLCTECSRKLGIDQFDFSMPIDFASFFGGFFEDIENQQFMPFFDDIKALKCNSCGNTFDDILKTGRLGCQNCYDTFEEQINPIIRRIQGADRHIGRIGKISDNKVVSSEEPKSESKEVSELEKLKQDLKKAIEEERYEDAAKLRDKIKKLEK